MNWKIIGLVTLLVFLIGALVTVFISGSNVDKQIQENQCLKRTAKVICEDKDMYFRRVENSQYTTIKIPTWFLCSKNERPIYDLKRYKFTSDEWEDCGFEVDYSLVV